MDATPVSTSDVDVQLAPFTVEPFTDQVFCQYVPADGAEHWLTGFTTDMTAGSHHLIVFRVDESQATSLPSTTRFPCDQLELPMGVDGMLPGSQQPHTEVDLPTGVAMRLGPTHGLFFQFHYVNPSETAKVATIRWHASSGEAGTPAAMMFFSNFDLHVPPGASVATRTCPIASDRTLLGATGHVHWRGVAFDASLDGQVIYHTDSWSEPPLAPLDIHVGKDAHLTWSCTYDNPDATTVEFGPSATANEMCIFAGIYYPAPDSQTDFGC